jgi:hypothetical protein
MLIRIDVYPDNSPQSTETLYASPANIVNNPNVDDNSQGRLVTVGRKGTDVVFPTEKAISRSHAVIRCVSSKGATGWDGCCIEARNEEESLACERSPYLMCLVLENLGKAGSFVVTPVDATNSAKEQKSKDKKDNDDTDDETDDEEITSQQQQSHLSQAINTSSLDGGFVPALSRATQELHGPDSVKLTRLDVGKNHILPLGTSDEDWDGNNSHRSSVVAIQFANACNTMKISLVPFHVVFSNTSKVETLRTSLRFCGGLAMDLPRAGRTTHLVTDELTPVAKQLISWCVGIPIVTPEFLKAYVGRKTLQDPLPTANDYLAEMKTKVSGNVIFWSLKPNQELLSRYVLLSVDPDESERLAESAGTHVVSLYSFDTEDLAMKHALELLERYRESSTICFCIETTNRSPSKARSLHRMLTKQLGVLSIGLRHLAKAISQQSSTLLGPGGQEIGLSISRISSAEGSIGDDGRTWSAASQSFAVASQSLFSQPSRARYDGNEGSNFNDEDIKPSRKESKIPETIPVLSTAKVREEKEDGQEQAIQAAGMSTKGKTNASASVGSRKAHQQPLGASDTNGWFTIAPKDDDTRALLRQQASAAYQKASGISLERAAPTSVGSVRIACVPPPLSSLSSLESQSPNDSFSSFYSIGRGGASGTSYNNMNNNASGGIPNFKKFRKNVVPKSSSDIRRIVLREFISEKTDKQRQMNEQQQELEEEQRLADALFRGDGTVGPRKRRRA